MVLSSVTSIYSPVMSTRPANPTLFDNTFQSSLPFTLNHQMPNINKETANSHALMVLNPLHKSPCSLTKTPITSQYQ